MPYLPQILEDFKIVEICSGCYNFIEQDLACNKKKEWYRDYMTSCCKFYHKESRSGKQNNYV